MDRFGVSGACLATAATADLCISSLWNPSAVRPIFVKEIWIFKTTAGAADIPKLRRISARGTPGSTITPAIQNDFSRSAAPVSGSLMDLNTYTVAPTADGNPLPTPLIPGAIGAAFIWKMDDHQPLWVLPGAGLGIFTGSALAFPVSWISWVWDE
jgi:hypothetical protein